LPLDTPILEFFERDSGPCDSATHESARLHHAEIAIEIFDLGFAIYRRGAIVAIEQEVLRRQGPGRPQSPA
jgi:hypothetical protein